MKKSACRHNYLFFIALMSLMTSWMNARPEEADLILHSGKVLTLVENQAAVQAIAIKGNRIQAVGSNQEILRLAGTGTKKIDLQGKLVIPGFIDSHAHFLGLGKEKQQVNLRYAVSWEDVVERVSQAAKATKPGAWILGRGWHQEKWNPKPAVQVGGFPVHDSLSRATPNHPVMLFHASGHAILANAKAMEMAGITDTTPNPQGGEILRDSKGKAIGVFTENAEELIDSAYGQHWKSFTPEQREEATVKEIEAADKECLANGVTTFHDAGAGFPTVDLYKKLVDTDRIGVRLWVMINAGNASLKERLSQYRMIGYKNGQLTVRGIKRLLDGALGSRSAWMLEPYTDRPGNTGLNTESLKELENTARIALAAGWQMCVHAIGDRANRELLDLYESVLRSAPPHSDLRWRIEHAQHLHPQEIPRFGRLGILAVMQGVHCTSDGPFIVKRLGEWRAQTGAYVWRSLLDSQALISNGTDAPVEEISPLACFYSSITRRQKDGSLFYPEQRMTRMEALKSYTIHGAYAGFEEKEKGSLVAGKLADMVVLSKDIMTIAEEEIPTTQVLMTLVGGKVRYSR